MKSLRTIFFLMFAFSICSIRGTAQDKPELAQAIIHYKFSHLRDTTNRQDVYNENMILFLGSKSSAYKSYDKKLAEALMRKQMQEQMAANPNGPIKITRGKNSGSNTEYYQFAAEGKLVRRERLINSYLIEEPLPVINWKIEKDTAGFGGLHCQKATTHFRGRDYTAWFCPDLPFHSGPWKLNGLPGVIVDAHDAKNEVVFKFDAVEDVSKAPQVAANAAGTQPAGGLPLFGVDEGDPNMIKLPTDAIKTTDKEFLNLRAAMQKDPDAFANSASASFGGGAPGSGGAPGGGGNGGPQQVFKIKVGPPAVINNPIELPEKK